MAKTRSQIAMERLAALQAKKDKQEAERKRQAQELREAMREAQREIDRATQAEYEAALESVGAELAELVGAETTAEVAIIKARVLRDDVVGALRTALENSRSSDEGDSPDEEAAPPESQSAPAHQAPTYPAYHGG